jgi:hypothetical protein
METISLKLSLLEKAGTLAAKAPQQKTSKSKSKPKENYSHVPEQPECESKLAKVELP